MKSFDYVHIKREVLETSTQKRSSTGHLIHKRNIDFTMEAKGIEMELKLERNDDFIDPNYHVIYGPSEIIPGSIPTEYNITKGVENCYYQGKVNDDSSSWVAIKTCDSVLV